jgi:lipopolysaccharide biosynthesis glycosyltransferase
MRTKIVYTIVCDENSTYIEQALISVYSLRKYEPKTIVEIVTDKDTEFLIRHGRNKILKYVNNIIAVECPQGFSPMQRSRYLKTNLRQFVKGDYLFIDCDTIVCNTLEDIDDVDADIAMVADINGELSLSDRIIIEKCKKAGFSNVKGHPYFNSGIIYVRDTPKAHQLYEEWYRLWKESDARGIPFDQPALCQANINTGLPIKELPGIWNCQIKFNNGHQFLKQANILHYYSNNGKGERSYTQDRIFEYVRGKGRIDEVVDKMICNPRTIFYTAMTINPDKAFEFFYSEMIHYFFNVPPAYRISLSIAKCIEKPIIWFNSLKNKWKWQR